ncbi:uncharacterized protein LOC119338564 isoform X1 [Triticum dicoccoides]|uniref:uncharacterized protein LOC119338564 isoform X1 n=1 Tax=Triticum dicoccoides TaxID=85692 RepID=UPI0018909A8B|nr:uncharacterized protein LOC119338564 isoform X1 [Triticum dicoccoides]
MACGHGGEVLRRRREPPGRERPHGSVPLGEKEGEETCHGDGMSARPQDFALPSSFAGRCPGRATPARVFLLLLFLVDIQEATWHLMSATCLSVTREMKEGCNGICTRSDFGHIIAGDWKSKTEDRADCFDSDYLEILWLAVPGSVRPTAASTR